MRARHLVPSSDGLIVVEAAPKELKMAHFPIQMRSLAFEDQ